MKFNQSCHVFSMLQLTLMIGAIFCGASLNAQSVGISSTAITPDASSILELRTTTKGLLIPRMTGAERDAIVSPATGLAIYNTSTNKFNFYNGSSWTVLFSGSAIVNSITGTSNRITIGGTASDPTVDIASTYVGQNSITTLGTITTGTWNGSIIGSGYGGTGNGFTKFSGATSSEKTYTLPDASTTILTKNYTGSLATGILKNTTSTGDLSIAIAADFPTLNQNTTGSAATLTTSRNIYGNAFNGSADLAQIIASTYGGTGNGYTKFTGPLSTEKTFTLPNANATILTDNAAVTAAQGGTGNTTYTVGDLLYASASTTLSKLAGVATGNALISGGTSTAPSWGKIGLTTHVSGILPIANGGTNSTATPTDGGIAYGNGTSLQYTTVGSTGQVLQSQGTNAPTWVDAGSMMFTGASNNTAVNNTTLYFPLNEGGIAGAAADAQAGLRTLVSRNGTVKNLYVKLSAALAAGKTGTVTLMKNGVATTLAVTLSVGPVDFNDTTDAITVAPGDELGIKVTTTGNVKFSWAADFTYQ